MGESQRQCGVLIFLKLRFGLIYYCFIKTKKQGKLQIHWLTVEIVKNYQKQTKSNIDVLVIQIQNQILE